MSLMEFAVVNHFMGPGPTANRPKGVSEEDLHHGISENSVIK